MLRRIAYRLLAVCAVAAALTSCSDTTAPDEDYRAIPEPVLGNHVFAELALGDFHSCGLKPNGEAFCWGINSQGQSGNGLDANVGVTTPLVVLGGHSFSSLTAGGSHTCGILASGPTVCWGNNAGGQLGTGNTIERAEPTVVSGDHAFVQVSASTTVHTCGLKANGEAWCWGINEFGRLGDGTQIARNVPTLVSGGIVFTSISAGGGHTCGLTANGTAYCWGFNGRGQVGDGSTQMRLVPVTVATPLKFTQIAAGFEHTCALDFSGAAYCWGDNVAAALGDGSLESKNTPVPVSGGNNFTTLAVGERHACGLTTEGIALCWGYNAFGAVGDGTFAPVRTAPVALARQVLFKRIAAGGYHTCGISTTDVTYCWGNNEGNQLGAP